MPDFKCWPSKHDGKKEGKVLMEIKKQSSVMLLLPDGKLTKSVEKLLGQSHAV